MPNVLTIDVEEYFHPTEVQLAMGSRNWSVFPSRIRSQTQLLLEIMDRHKVRATFFVLGWVADHHPSVIREIARAGHEIGCHSYSHELVYDLTPNEFKEDLRRAVCAIEDACGVTPRSYRAPSYSITSRSMWALELLVEAGFTHDSSIYPIRHDRYGIPGFPRHAHPVSTPSGPILEIPVATALLSKKTVAPVGGGAYLRLLPYRYTAAGIRSVNDKEQQAACIYIHPWELDPQLPRLISGTVSRLRTYTGLRSMRSKLERLVSEFEFDSLTNVHPVPLEMADRTVWAARAAVAV
jgi:polysaccharide deacetylase family protein (PEP-CTERM system associated)